MVDFAALRDYDEAELLALPRNSRLLFAENVHDGSLTYDSTSTWPYTHRKRRILQPPGIFSRNYVQNALSRIHALRCISHGLSSFSIYPINEQEYNVSKFLWKAANNFTFQASEAAMLFHRNVFIISMPGFLFEFLTSVTWEQIENALTYVLICLTDGHEGMQALRKELAPPLVAKVEQFAIVDDPSSLVSPEAFRLLVDILMDRVQWIGPWVIPTSLYYLSASDMTQLFSNRLEHDIFSSPGKYQVMQSMIWNIYRDWQTYHQVLVQNGGWTRRDAIKLMTRIIAKGTQAKVGETARVVIRLSTEDGNSHTCSDLSFFPSHEGNAPYTSFPILIDGLQHKKSSFLASLPFDVIVSKIIPKVFESFAEGGDECRRTDGRPCTKVGRTNTEVETGATSSLKNWVLENCKLEYYYRKSIENLDGGDDDEGNADSDEDGLIDVDVIVDDEVDEVMEEELFDEVGDVEDSIMVEIEEPNLEEGDVSEMVDSKDSLTSDVDVQSDEETVAVEFSDEGSRAVVMVGMEPQTEWSHTCVPRRFPDTGSGSSSSHMI